MNVLEVNSTDLDGRIFNGFDLQCALNKRGINTRQIVYRKFSQNENVILEEYPQYVYERIQYEETLLAWNNLLTPWEYFMRQSEAYKKADIVHYHLIHHNMLSMINLPDIMNEKPTIWTIHDPWVVTGHCIYPLRCEKWKNGCQQCEHIQWEMPLKKDTAYLHWKIKERSYKKIDPDIVVSTNFMKSYIENSLLTEHFQHIHIIPFGLDEDYFFINKNIKKEKWGISNEKIVIGFRASDFPVKGCQYIYQMMEQLGEVNKKITYICLGDGTIPQHIREKYKIKQLGWEKRKEIIIEFYGICDIFLMPSLAESFGLMAIEAMAQRCSVVCFKNTVLEEITEAPEIGCAASYCDAKSLAEIVKRLIENVDEIKYRGEQGRSLVRRKYNFEQYVTAHKQLYQNVWERNMYEKL